MTWDAKASPPAVAGKSEEDQGNERPRRIQEIEEGGSENRWVDERERDDRREISRITVRLGRDKGPNREWAGTDLRLAAAGTHSRRERRGESGGDGRKREMGRGGRREGEGEAREESEDSEDGGGEGARIGWWLRCEQRGRARVRARVRTARTKGVRERRQGKGHEGGLGAFSPTGGVIESLVPHPTSLLVAAQQLVLRPRSGAKRGGETSSFKVGREKERPRDRRVRTPSSSDPLLLPCHPCP